jgi:hypothetical protein
VNQAHGGNTNDVSGVNSSVVTPFLSPSNEYPPLLEGSAGNSGDVMSGVEGSLDLSRLPDGTDLPGDAGLSMSNGAARDRDSQRDESFKAHRAVFFFKLGRELEKVRL